MNSESTINAQQNSGNAIARLSGFLLVVFTLPFIISAKSHNEQFLIWNSWFAVVNIISSLSLLVAGFTILKFPKSGRYNIIIAAFGIIISSIGSLVLDPVVDFATSLLIISLITYVFHVTAKPCQTCTSEIILFEQVQGGIIANFSLILFIAFLFKNLLLSATTIIMISSIITYILIFIYLFKIKSRRNIRWDIIFTSLIIAPFLAGSVFDHHFGAIGFLQIPLILFLFLEPRPFTRPISNEWWATFFEHPGRLLVGTFFIMCLIGTIILSLPQVSSDASGISVINAAFTAVSAVCVTGLSVLDTAHDFSFWGQFSILILIQLGGLGIMTFSTAAIRALGKRMGLRHEAAVASLISQQDRTKLFSAARIIIYFTFISELIGALILIPAFVSQGDGVLQAAWRGTFTSISAFCNAGFALQSDSLIPYNSNPVIIHTVGLLIILGGLSPFAVIAIPKLISGKYYKVSVQIKLALIATIILLLAGFFFILVLEWDHSLSSYPVSSRLNNAWFQSVTLRTAGFNSIDISSSYPSTLFIMMILMFIGGSPGGTAGGIKTTTAAVILLAAVNAARGRNIINIFKKQIPSHTLYKALAILTLSSLGLIWAIITLEITQSIPSNSIIFEVVSALGTVGLSLGATTQLDGIGKIIIIFCMFVGRVGTLTFFVFLTDRVKPKVLKRPEEAVDVG